MEENNNIAVNSEERPSSGPNEYQVKREKRGKKSILNLLLLQVGICLAVSLGVFLFRAISGGASVVQTGVGFFEFLTV